MPVHRLQVLLQFEWGCTLTQWNGASLQGQQSHFGICAAALCTVSTAVGILFFISGPVVPTLADSFYHCTRTLTVPRNGLCSTGKADCHVAMHCLGAIVNLADDSKQDACS